MGSTNISSVGKVFAQSQMAGVGTPVADEDIEVAFTEVMSQMAGMIGNGIQSGGQGFGAEENAVSMKSATVSDEYDRCQYRETVRAQESAAKVSRNDETSQKLEDFAENVKEVLEEELGITEEQIEETMTALGLTFLDLMNPKQLAALVMELTGAESVSALLCDGDFLTVMQAVGELGETLKGELGLTAEELAQLADMLKNETVVAGDVTDNVQKIDKAAKYMSTAEDGQALDSAMEVVDQRTDNLAADNGMTEQAVENLVSDDVAEEPVSDEALEKLVVDETADVQDAAESEDVMVEVSEVSDKEEMTPDHGAFGNQDSHTANHNIVMNQNVTQNVSAQPLEGNPGFTNQLDVANIIRQIVEYSKVTIGNQTTTMEMQLNPENLGKIYLEVSSKDGVVSAHITAQNEAVKEVLESQLVELRQSMNQSGVKVDAVEVTVGSHEFERNLEQNAKQDERQAEEQEKAAKQTRRINLNDLDELSGLMTEEESLVAQMMADQGNSIDFTA